MNKKTCSESRSIQTHRVFPADLNHHGTLFGGNLMSYIDDTSSIAITRHCRRHCVTASTDSLDFLHPIYVDHSVCIEAYVSGVGTRSMEVFNKVIGENLLTGERYLAATSFMTFVAFDPDGGEIVVPKIIPETDEEKMVCGGYEERKKKRLHQRAFNEAFFEQVDLKFPWGK